MSLARDPMGGYLVLSGDSGATLTKFGEMGQTVDTMRTSAGSVATASHEILSMGVTSTALSGMSPLTAPFRAACCASGHLLLRLRSSSCQWSCLILGVG